MASLEEQKGRFRIVFRYGGEKFQRTLDTDNKQAALAKKSRLEENLRLLKLGRLEYPPGADLPTLLLSDGKLNAAPTVTKRISLAEFFKRYEEERPPNKEVSTTYTEKIHIAHLLRILGSRTALSDVNLAALQQYINVRSKEESKRGGPVSHITVKKELSTLSSIWNQWGIIHGLVFFPLSLRNLKYTKVRERPAFQTWQQIERRIARGKLAEGEQAELWGTLYLTVPELAQLLEYVKETGCLIREHRPRQALPWVYPMFAFCAYTGCRRSEMLRSRLEDIDFEAGEIHLREKKKDPKREYTVRHVPMAGQLRQVLQEWIKVHPGGPFTFCRAAGEPLTKAMATHYFRWTLAKSKWDVIKGWHVLRHSWISNLASRGIGENLIQTLAGHLNRETTRRYAHLLPSTANDAVHQVFG